MLDLGGRTTREYFIAIDEVEWDYAPLGHDACHGGAFDWTARKFVDGNASSARIGSTYTKARRNARVEETRAS